MILSRIVYCSSTYFSSQIQRIKCFLLKSHKMLPESAAKVLHKVAKGLNFVNYKLDTSSGSTHGDNIKGVMIAVCLTGTRTNGHEEYTDSINLLCKLSPENKERCKVLNINATSEREHFFYTTIFPEFVKFQREKGLTESESFLSIPKVYASESDSANSTHVLVMEDLRSRDYKLWPKSELINIDHELFLLKELGKFHGISLALKDQNPDLFKTFEWMLEPLGVMTNETSPLFKELTRKISETVLNPSHKAFVNVSKYLEILKECSTQDPNDKFNVICHDDLWITNFMFQYNDDSKKSLRSICLIDWGQPRYCSLAQDIVFQIFSLTDKKFRDQHYQQLLQTYYDSLSQIVRRLGSDPDKLFTYNDLLSELQKFGKYALVCAPMIHQFRLATSEDVVDLNMYAGAIEKGIDANMFKKFGNDKQRLFSRLVNETVIDLIDYGYL